MKIIYISVDVTCRSIQIIYRAIQIIYWSTKIIFSSIQLFHRSMQVNYMPMQGIASLFENKSCKFLLFHNHCEVQSKNRQTEDEDTEGRRQWHERTPQKIEFYADPQKMVGGKEGDSHSSRKKDPQGFSNLVTAIFFYLYNVASMCKSVFPIFHS